jgi:hypothetical protein
MIFPASLQLAANRQGMANAVRTLRIASQFRMHFYHLLIGCETYRTIRLLLLIVAKG